MKLAQQDIDNLMHIIGDLYSEDMSCYYSRYNNPTIEVYEYDSMTTYQILLRPNRKRLTVRITWCECEYDGYTTMHKQIVQWEVSDVLEYISPYIDKAIEYSMKKKAE